MRIECHLLTMLLGAAVLAAPAASQPADDDYSSRLIADAGFIPISEMNFGGRDVRRVLPMDPYGILPIAGIELERHSDGRLTLRPQYRGWAGPAYPLAAGEWEALAALEAPAFAPPGKKAAKAKPGVVVHCWHGLRGQPRQDRVLVRVRRRHSRHEGLCRCRAPGRHAEEGLR
jgi:hypothetical protein